MQGVNQSYTNHIKRKCDYFGHLWQGRYNDFYIAKESYLLECGRYIERNPVRVGIVQEPGAWIWSSYRHHAEGEENPLIDSYVKDQAPDRSTFMERAAYRDYVKQDRPYESVIDKHFKI
jgi:putative transposase